MSEYICGLDPEFIDEMDARDGAIVAEFDAEQKEHDKIVELLSRASSILDRKNADDATDETINLCDQEYIRTILGLEEMGYYISDYHVAFNSGVRLDVIADYLIKVVSKRTP